METNRDCLIGMLLAYPLDSHICTCCSFYLQSGHSPAVRVYEVSSRLQVSQFSGHKFGVTCVAFSPNNKYLVSIGTQHDMVTNVWNWRQGSKVASNKISNKVSLWY